MRYTNFYPLNIEANDHVDPVISVQSVQFQRIFPRYSVSASENRDLEIGAMFTVVPTVSLHRN